MELIASIPQVIVNPSNLTDKKTGEYLREQTVLILATGRLGPVETKLVLNAGEPPLQAGRYDLSGDVLSHGKWGSVNFQVRRNHLTAIADRKPA